MKIKNIDGEELSGNFWGKILCRGKNLSDKEAREIIEIVEESRKKLK